MATPAFVLTCFLAVFFLDNAAAQSTDCTNSCDIELSKCTLTAPYIEAGEPTSVNFEATFLMTKNGYNVKPVDEKKLNFDCEMLFAESNLAAGPAVTTPADAFAQETKPKFSDTADKKCVVYNENDMRAGLYENQPKTLSGYCNITLPKSSCEKANYLCLKCPRPTSASYTKDDNADNNMKCVSIRKLVYCEVGRKCYKGGDLTKSLARCNPKDYCFRYRPENLPAVHYGCTPKKNFCGDYKDCLTCDKDGCNGAGHVRPVVLAFLTTAIVTITAFLLELKISV